MFTCRLMNKEDQQQLFFRRRINGRPVQVLNRPVNFVVGIKMYIGMDPLSHSLACFVLSLHKIPAQ